MIRRKQILETACNWRWCTHSLSDDRMGIRRLCYVTHVVSPAPRYPNNWPYSGLRPIFEPWRTGYAVQHAGASFKMAAGGRKSPTNHVTAKANLPATRLCHVSHREITTSLGGRIASHRSTSSRHGRRRCFADRQHYDVDAAVISTWRLAAAVSCLRPPCTVQLCRISAF